MTQNKRSKSFISDAMLIVVAIIWGSGFIATKLAIDSNMSSSLIMVLRFMIATLVLTVFFFKKVPGIKADDLKKGAIAGTLLFMAFFAQTLGLEFTTPSNNAFLTSTNVIMVPFITWAIFRKRPPSQMFFSAALSLVGISFLTFSFSSGFTFNIGDILTLICALLFAGHISFLSYCVNHMDTARLTLLQMATAAVLSLLAFIFFDLKSLSSANFGTGLAPVLYLGLFSTCLAFFMQTSAQKNTSSTKAAVILSTEALFGSVFSVILGFEKLTINMVAGGVLLLVAVLLTELKPAKKSTAPRESERPE